MSALNPSPDFTKLCISDFSPVRKNHFLKFALNRFPYFWSTLEVSNLGSIVTENCEKSFSFKNSFCNFDISDDCKGQVSLHRVKIKSATQIFPFKFFSVKIRFD